MPDFKDTNESHRELWNNVCSILQESGLPPSEYTAVLIQIIGTVTADINRFDPDRATDRREMVVDLFVHNYDAAVERYDEDRFGLSEMRAEGHA
jgi:hypothetical protein